MHRYIRLYKWPYGARLPLVIACSSDELYLLANKIYMLLPLCLESDLRDYADCLNMSPIKISNLLSLIEVVWQKIRSDSPIVLLIDSIDGLMAAKIAIPFLRSIGFYPTLPNVVCRNLMPKSQIELNEVSKFEFELIVNSEFEGNFLFTACFYGYNGNEVLRTPDNIEFPLSLLPISYDGSFALTYTVYSNGSFRVIPK